MTQETKKRWAIWCEGYAATGEFCPHYFVGFEEGPTFVDACHRWFEKHPSPTYDPVTNRNWGMNFFDNETDAAAFLGGRLVGIPDEFD